MIRTETLRRAARLESKAVPRERTPQVSIASIFLVAHGYVVASLVVFSNFRWPMLLQRPQLSVWGHGFNHWQGHCRLFCFQEGAPKAAPKFVSKMRACAKVFKCLCGVRWSVDGGCGCTCSKGQGPRNMYEYVDCFNVFLIIFIYFSSCLGVNVVMIEFFYPRFALSLICDIQP